MVTYKSTGGRVPTKAEQTWNVVKAIMVFLAVVGACIGLIVWLGGDNEPKESTEPLACSPILDQSVFTTGDPLLDQRILYSIMNDKSEGKTQAGGMVKHIWETGDFKFEKPEQVNLWEEATAKVQSLSPISEPALSITSSGVITPYTAPKEAAGITWSESEVSGMPAQRSTFLMSSKKGEKQSASVPVVLLSINGGKIVPSPTLGAGSEYVSIAVKEVCK